MVEVAGLDVATIGTLPSALPELVLPSVDLGAVQGYFGAAFAVAFERSDSYWCSGLVSLGGCSSRKPPGPRCCAAPSMC